MDYAAPVEEMMFAIRAIAGADALQGLPGGEHLEPDTLRAVLDAASAFAAGELAPLNRAGDVEGASPSVAEDDPEWRKRSMIRASGARGSGAANGGKPSRRGSRCVGSTASAI